MIDRNYSKDAAVIQQKLTTLIKADKETVFSLLASTEGISKWFPQLSIEDEQVLFDLGNGIFEKMSLIDYKTNHFIAYEWAAGKIEFSLEEKDNGTQLILQETLPIEFNAIPEDFTGWYIQLKNIKNLAENNEVSKVEREEIQEFKINIIEKLA